MISDEEKTAALLLHQEALRAINDNMVDLRAAYWTAGNERAALAVDSARHKIACALHNLQRCNSLLPSASRD